MIALYTMRPAFCAWCAREIQWNQYTRDDWDTGCSFACPDCDTHYQRISEADAFKAATEANGDLARMYAS
jgi:hypothetical protein